MSLFRSTSRGTSGDLSSDEDALSSSSKTRGRPSFTKLFKRKKKSGSKSGKTSAQAARALDGKTPAAASRSRSSSPRTSESGTAPGRPISPSGGSRWSFGRSKSGESGRSSPSPSRSSADEARATSKGVTPSNAFDDDDDDEDEDEEDDEEEEDDDDEWEPVTDDEIQLFRNTSINTGDRPVMNILQSQSQLPDVKDGQSFTLHAPSPF